MSSAQEKKIVPVFDDFGNHRPNVMPSDITVSDQGHCGFFGKYEVEVAAGRLVSYFQWRGGWFAFTLDELVKFYFHNNWPTEQILYGLHGCWADDGGFRALRMAPPYLVDFGTGHFRVTERFIEQCLAKCPGTS